MSEGSVVYAYTRREAIEDGTLVDVTEVAKGLILHTVVTSNVWERCVKVPEALEGLQDEQGRLGDVLDMALRAAQGKPDDDLVEFQVVAVDAPPDVVVHKLWLHLGPGDEGEPVLTIMFPEDY